MAAWRARLALTLGCLALLGLAGCGDDDEGSTATTPASSEKTQPPATETTAPDPAAKSPTFGPKPHQDSGGGSKQFEVKGGDNSVQEFGEEVGGSEFEEAATALHSFLDARAAGAWTAACSYLADDTIASIEQLARASKRLEDADCGELLEALSKGVPPAALAEAARADVGSLRREGDRAFILYRGVGDTVYAISMRNEEGAWKVAGLSGTPLG